MRHAISPVKGMVCVLFLFALPAYVSGQEPDPFQTAIRFSAKTQTVEEIIQAVEQQTQLSFVYTSSVLDPETVLVLKKRRLSLRAVLTALEGSLKLKATLLGEQIVLRKTNSRPGGEAKPSAASGQEKRFTLNGYLRNAENGEVLINAQVFDEHTGKGVLTNNYGFFSLSLPAGSISLVAAERNYRLQRHQFFLSGDTTLDIDLHPFVVDEVEIVAEEARRIDKETEMSSLRIPVDQIKEIPALLGEVDVVRAVQMTPGVQSGSEGLAGMYIRGGGPDQNLILLDDVPLYNANHLGGLFSVFNADVLSMVKLTKGGFPARYGGRLSSVLDIRMKDGNAEKLEASGNLGLISGKLSLNGPLGKRTTFMVSVRRTWLDLIVGLATMFSDETFGYRFFDVHGKITHTLSEKDRVYLSLYGGDDVFFGKFDFRSSSDDRDRDYFEQFQRYNQEWGNRVAAFRWNRVWNEKLFSNLTATYSRYQFDSQTRYERFVRHRLYMEPREERGRFLYRTGVRDLGLKMDFDYYPSPSHNIKFGGALTRHRFVPGALAYSIKDGNVSVVDTTLREQRSLSWEGGLYLEDEIRLGSRFSANLGGHLAWFHVAGKDYLSPQARLAMRFALGKSLALKASWVQTTQFLHMLSNSGFGLPMDFWVPATAVVPPQHALQVAAGFGATLGEGAYELSLEGYHKEMQGLIEYQEGNNVFIGEASASDWEQQVVTGGTGQAYGVEFLVQKKTGKTRGWLGYTLAWNYRRFTEINGGQPYPYRFDRRHDISLALSHTFSERLQIGLNWVYGTGNALTFPTAAIAIPGATSPAYDPFQDLAIGFGRGGIGIYEEGRNAFRMQPYHRLDLSLAFRKKKPWGERTWTIGVFNAYSRLNPYAYIMEYRYAGNGYYDPYIRKLSLFPIIPTLSYSFSFQ